MNGGVLYHPMVKFSEWHNQALALQCKQQKNITLPGKVAILLQRYEKSVIHSKMLEDREAARDCTPPDPNADLRDKLNAKPSAYVSRRRFAKFLGGEQSGELNTEQQAHSVARNNLENRGTIATRRNRSLKRPTEVLETIFFMTPAAVRSRNDGPSTLKQWASGNFFATPAANRASLRIRTIVR